MRPCIFGHGSGASLPARRGSSGLRAVAAACRQHSVGKALITRDRGTVPGLGVQRDAQTHAISFYEKLGYEVDDAEFLDAGTPHRRMHKHT